MLDMKRREFIALVGGGALLLAAKVKRARGQQPARVQRIGYLGLGPPPAWATRVEVLRAGPRDLGWIEGKNIVIEFRWADEVEQLPGLAAELVRLPVDVTLRVQLVLVDVQAAEDFEGAFATMVREGAGVFLSLPSPLFTPHRRAGAKLALNPRLPGIFGHRDFLGDVGPLMSYAANIDKLNQPAAFYIEKFLKGAKPADLP